MVASASVSAATSRGGAVSGASGMVTSRARGDGKRRQARAGALDGLDHAAEFAGVRVANELEREVDLVLGGEARGRGRGQVERGEAREQGGGDLGRRVAGDEQAQGRASGHGRRLWVPSGVGVAAAADAAAGWWGGAR
jgi:hypothetical protein